MGGPSLFHLRNHCRECPLAISQTQLAAVLMYESHISVFLYENKCDPEHRVGEEPWMRRRQGGVDQ